MTNDQILILGLLLATMTLFLWGRWRHDMVALGALLACVFAGLVPSEHAFAGFGHPAVITVACILVLSRGLQNSGAVDVLAGYVLPAKAGPTLTIAALTGLATVLSGFMNNVGALALLMPVAIQIAARLDLPPGRVLMPLAFGSILGGMVTLIGTPPNLIVAGFRAESGLANFRMFDFTPVGLAVAGVGLIFVTLVGWRLVPVRKRASVEDFKTGAYLTEARVPKASKVVGMTLRQIEGALEETEAQVVGLIRNEVRLTAPHPYRMVLAGDILVIEAEVKALPAALSTLGLKLEEAKQDEQRKDSENEEEKERAKSGKAAKTITAITATQSTKLAKVTTDADADTDAEKPAPSDDIVLVELAVLPQSDLVGRSASDIQLRTHYGINMLAVSRQGRRSTARLRTMVVRASDVLLMQGPPEAIAGFASDTGCVPLAERALRIPNRRNAILSGGILALAIGAATLGLSAAVAFAAGVLAAMILRTVPLRQIYTAIDWPVIVLLAALIPVAGAMESTGAADLIARFLLDSVAQGHAVIGLALILVVTMSLSDLMNNAATAAMMCPIALGTAGQLGANADPFLMAVAVGASCAFLTPIGHQNNTLILGPGGFRFGDYWRLGLPLELLVVAVSLPMLLLVWPL
ncbi:MAG: SLC13 family permease [Candidatus Competibacteraceae bacterium]|nr:SLC13 family permease [Candidatus Competibacteraceae bacterium]